MTQKKKPAKNTFEADLIASMGEVLDYVKGSREALEAHRFRPEHVRLVRAKTKKSQTLASMTARSC